MTQCSLVDMYRLFKGTCSHAGGAASFSEPLVHKYQSARRHIVQGSNLLCHDPNNFWSHIIYKAIWRSSLLLITFAAVGLTQDQRGINCKCVRYSRHVTRLLRMPVSWLLTTPQGPPTPALWTCCIYYTSDNSKTSYFLFYYVKEYLESRILTSQGTALKIRCW